MRKTPLLIFSAFGLSLSGCASVAPNFDVPVDERNVPSTGTIVKRITCELVDLVKPGPDAYEHRKTLLTHDYEVAMLLTLDVNDSGGIAPTFNLPQTYFAFNVGANLNQSRQDTLNINLVFSMRELAHAWETQNELAQCPAIDTNLAGDLGLRKKVSAALETANLKSMTGASPSDGEFSGTINFTVTKNLNAVGPTWTLRHFVGPGGFASLSEVNNDKLSFGFAMGKNANKPFNPQRPVAMTYDSDSMARATLGRQLNSEINTQLNAIRNSLR